VLARSVLARSVLALCCAACTHSEPGARALGTPPAADLSERYRRCWDHVNQRRWDAFAACYTDDVESTRAGEPSLRGKAAVLEAAQRDAQAFPDGKGEPQVVLSDEHRVAAVVRYHGTHTGALVGPQGELAATNRRVGFFAMHWLDVDAAATARKERWVSDGAPLLHQLGASPGPARAVAEEDWQGSPLLIAARHDETERKNAEAVRASYELFNRRDPGYGAYLADDVVESTNSDPVDVVGKAALMEYNQGLIAAFPDLRVVIDDVLAAGEYVAWSGRVRGTSADGGKPIDVAIIELTRWRAGTIVRSWPFLNGMEMAAQLAVAGAAP
jgi:predicted ester cyclase